MRQQPRNASHASPAALAAGYLTTAAWLLSGCGAEKPLPPSEQPSVSTSAASTSATSAAPSSTSPLVSPSNSGETSLTASPGPSSSEGSPTSPSLSSTTREDDSGELTGSAADSGLGEATRPAPSSGAEAPSDAGVLDELDVFLGIPAAQRPPLASQPFARAAISKAAAEQATQRLWQDHTTVLRQERQAEHDARTLRLGDYTLRYDYTVFGSPPESGRSLFISLHGGGEAAASVNDEQWENQKVLYQPAEGIYLSPRAPTDTWNMWHQEHIDPLFTRLIENFIVFEGVDPNRVYVMGYSAGGDGVYQLGPRMADQWAAASAMAGHPNEAKPLSLRNIGFTIHVGGNDTAFERNTIAVEWQNQLEALQNLDPDGYVHEVQVHAGKGHWMDLEDSVAVPWMAAFTRNPTPQRVVWYQDDAVHDRFYWLSNPSPVKETQVAAELKEQTITLSSEDVRSLRLRLRDDMLDLDAPVTVNGNGAVLFDGTVSRTIETIHRTLAERGDPQAIFSAEVAVTFP